MCPLKKLKRITGMFAKMKKVNSALILEMMEVHYAADIPLNNYFSKKEIYQMTNSNKEYFDLKTVNIQKNSLLQFSKNSEDLQISGITVPWIYFGMLFSTFCWHTEDLYLYSLNYMHSGAPKIWYGISHDHKEKMDEFIRNKYYATLLKQPDLVHKLTVHIDPLELQAHGIKVFKAIQNPGEMILTLPKGYHSGFSTGLNMSEAVNFSVTFTLIM